MDLSDILLAAESPSSQLTFVQKENPNDVEKFIAPDSERLDGPSTKPLTCNWILPILYRGEGNEERVWLAGFDGHVTYTVHGLTEGLKQKSEKRVEPKGGKTIETQAHQDMRTKWLTKRREGYNPLAGESHVTGTQQLPMLAQKFKPTSINPPAGYDKGSKLKQDQYPVAVSAKVDGVRVIARWEGGEIVLRSRKNKVYPFFDSIREEIKRFIVYLPPGSELDGEFIIPEDTFNSFIKTMRKTVNRPLPEMEAKMQYYVFDFIDQYQTMTLEQRISMLQEAYLMYLADGNSFQQTSFLTHTPVYDEPHLLRMYDQILEMGFEGIIIRRYSSAPNKDSHNRSLYTRKKSVSMLKYKPYDDKEVTIVGGEPATGAHEGAVVWKVRDESGNIFSATPEFPIETRRKWMTELSRYVGKIVTIRYQEINEYGIPRFPVMVSFRDYE